MGIWDDDADGKLGDRIAEGARIRAEQERNARRFADSQRTAGGGSSDSRSGCPLLLVAFAAALTAVTAALWPLIRLVM